MIMDKLQLPLVKSLLLCLKGLNRYYMVLFGVLLKDFLHIIGGNPPVGLVTYQDNRGQATGSHAPQAGK